MKPTWTHLRPLGVDNPQAGVPARREWLLAEHRLAGRDRREDLLLVHRAPGSDKYRVHASVGDEILGAGVHGRSGQARGHLPGTGLLDVVDRHDRSAGERPGDPADVVLADHAGADDANPDGHRGSPAVAWLLPVPSVLQVPRDGGVVELLVDVDENRVAFDLAGVDGQRGHLGNADRLAGG